VIDRTPLGRAILSGAVVDAAALVIPWADPAAQWGWGVFETIAVRDSEPRRLHEHLARLTVAAGRLGVPLPPPAELHRATRTVADDLSGERGWVKIAVSRSGEYAVFGGLVDPAEVGRPVAAIVLPWRRHRLDPATGIKSLSYVQSVLGLEEARRRGADEGLWLNERGHVIEASTGNVFVVRGRAAVTPNLKDGARDGVTRARAISLLRRFGLSVRQSKVRIATLRGADEVFLTSSLRGARPVVRIDGRSVRGGEPGTISRRVAAAIDEERDDA
jgi:branched-chain amino acid aminotransferase